MITCEDEPWAELLPQPEESPLLEVLWLEVDDIDELELELEELEELESAEAEESIEPLLD